VEHDLFGKPASTFPDHALAKERFQERVDETNGRPEQASRSCNGPVRAGPNAQHLRKLRWIGKESEAEKILAVLDVRRRRKAPLNKRRRGNRL
jgi:hypothetical protein